MFDRADIFAVYSGETFERPGRGILAAVARGVGVGSQAQQAAHEAAHVAIHLLVEGYFGAAATLSVSRAAALALTGANTWMFSQSRTNPEHAMRASLAALIFAGRRVGIVNVGDCRVYRVRHGQLTPLTDDHTQPLADGTTVLTRSVGGDAELHVEYGEDEPQVSDRYIVVSKGAYSGVAQLTERLVAPASPDEAAESLAPAQPTNDSGRDATSVVIDVIRLPESNFDELSAAFQNRPLRG